MPDRFEYENRVTDEGNPDGGYAHGTGLQIEWQRGPVGRGEDRLEPNGAFVEDVILVAKLRLEHYQTSKFKCMENHKAIAYLELALEQLHKRTAEREKRGVEGTWGV